MRTSAPQRDESSLLGGFLRGLTRLVTRRARLTLWIVAIASAAALGLTVREMGIKTRRVDLLGPKSEFHRRWTRYTDSFGDETEIVVAIESERPELIERALDDLGSRMDAESEPFRNVVYRVDADALHDKGLQCYSPAELEAGLARLQDYGPVLQGRWDLLKLDLLVDRLRNQIQSRSQRGAREAAAPLWQQAELLAASLSRNLANPEDFRSPWPDILPGDRLLRAGPRQRVHCLSEDAKIGYIRAVPTENALEWHGTSASLARLRELIAEVAPDHPNVRFGVTGISALESDELRRSQIDMLLAAGIAIAAIAVVLFLGFRSFRHPLAALVVIVAGVSWSCGYATLVVGHLTILSIAFAAVLIGLGIDYSIHYLARYIELRHAGEDLRSALIQSSTGRGPGILTSALTTALAFFAATFTDFLGISQLGIVAGGAILICAVATFVILPPLVFVCDRDRAPRRISTPFEGGYLRQLTGRFPRTVTIVSLVLVAGLASQIFRYRDGRIEPRIRLDDNAIGLHAEDAESVVVQRRMFEKTNDSLLYAVSVADTFEEARALRRRFETLPTVHHVEDLASRLPGPSADQSRRLMQSYRSRLAGLPRSPARLAGSDPARVGRSLEQLYLLARSSGDPQAGKVERVLDDFLDRFQEIPLREQTEFVSRYQQRSVAAIHSQFVAIASASNPTPIRRSDVPDALLSQFRSADGKWMMRIFPREQIWDTEPLARFVADLRSVDPDVTGVPLQNYESARQIRASCIDAALYAVAIIGIVLVVGFLQPLYKLVALALPLAVIGFAVFALHARRADINFVFLALVYAGMTAAIAAFLDFRQFRDALLALIAPIGGCGMLFGFLALIGSDLNPANLIVLPLLLGMGVDNGVHLLHDFRSQPAGKYQTSPSTFSAIVLTSLTTMIGFGALVIASHQGLRSIGTMMAIGMACCLFVSLIALPSLLAALSRRGASDGGAGRSADSSESRASSSAASKSSQRRAA